MAHWRDTHKPARFFFLDARAGIPLLATLLHVKPWTVTVAVLVIGLFWYLERVGLDIASASRALRCYFAGDVRPASPAIKTRSMIDYQRNPGLEMAKKSKVKGKKADE